MANYETRKRQSAVEYWKKYYGQLKGGRITHFDMCDDGFPVFKILHPVHGLLNIEVSCDSEGNGAGFLFIGSDYEEKENDQH